MEVRKGYKQTEVGVIPEDWEVKELYSFSIVSSGGTPNRSVALYWNGNIPWITTSQINFNTILEANEFITEEGLNYSAAKINKAGTLLMAMYGQGKTRGKVAILGLDATTNQACASISLNESVLKEYIFCNLSARYDEIRGLSNNGSQENLNGDLIKRIRIPLPSKSEQTAISRALSDANALISSLEKLIEKKRAIKQGCMQELLRVKEGWEEKTLGEISDILTGFPFQSEGYSKSGTRLLRGSNIKRGKTDWNEDICQYWQKITPELFKYQLNKGDVVIAMDGSLVGKSFAQLSDIDLPAILLQRVARIRSTIVDINYLKELICSDMFTVYCDSVKTASAIPHISPSDIYNYKIYYPLQKTEQIHIATILSDMDAEIAGLEDKLSKYKMVKQGMMQELLTGRIRLVDNV